MKLKRVFLKFAAALFVAALCFTPMGVPSKAQAGPHTASSGPGCAVMPSAPALAQRIFGPYAWSGGGGSNLPGTSALRELVPPGGYATDCVFARKLVKQDIPTDSDVLFTGYVQFSNSAGVLQSWSRITSRYALTSVNQPPYHYAEKSGVSVGYRDGLNEIAYAFWKDGGNGQLHNIAGSSLRPLVYSVICASC